MQKRIPIPVEKRGGSRRAIKRRPQNKTKTVNYYKGSTRGLAQKKLGEYRFLICTDLEPDDMIFLTMFTAWVKANEQFFDSRSKFPIYGFVIGEGKNKRVKAQRAREFLHEFANVMAWDDEEHHLYKGYVTAGQRVWFDGVESDVFENEHTLVDPDILDDPDYPDPESFETAAEELMQSKPSNLFAIYLKPPRFLQNPEIAEYLYKVPGAIYGSWNIHTILSDSPEMAGVINRFLNRSEKDALLLYVDSKSAFGGDDNIMGSGNYRRLFNEIDDGQCELITFIKDTMYAWNDNVSERIIGRLSKEPEFEGCEFETRTDLMTFAEKLTPEKRAKLSKSIQILESILTHSSRQFGCADPLVMVAMLTATNILKAPFRLEASMVTVGDDIKCVSAPSNTWVLRPKGGDIKAFMEKMLLNTFFLAKD